MMTPSIRDPIVIAVPMAMPLPTASADRNGYHGRIRHRAGAEESPTERTEKRSVSRQPSPGVKSGVPRPSSAGKTVAIAVHRSRSGGLITQAGVVLGTHVAPGVQLVLFLAVEFFRLQQIAEHDFPAFA